MKFLFSTLLVMMMCCCWPTPLSRAQSIAAVLAELRRLGCTAANCTGMLRCGAEMTPVSTDFGSIVCAQSAPDQLQALHLDGRRVALSGGDNALVMPSGNTLQNVTVTDQPHLVRMDFSGLAELADLQVLRNAALVSLVAAGRCLRIFSNPKLVSIVFASTMVTQSVQLLDLPQLAAIDLTAIGAQLREISVVSLGALRSIVGIRGRSLEQVKIVGNAQLAAADDLDIDVTATLNVSRNPNLVGTCRVRAPPNIATCTLDTACLFAADSCLAELPGNCTRLTAACSAGVAPPSVCAPPAHTCAPPALRFTVLAPPALARASDVPICVSVGAASTIPRDNSSFPCNVSVTSAVASGMSFASGAMTCALSLGARSAVRSFVARAAATGSQVTLQRTSAAVPADASSDCGMAAQFVRATGATLARFSVTSVIDFVDDASLTMSTSTRLTLPTVSDGAVADSNDSNATAPLNATLTSNATNSVEMISNDAPSSDIGLIVGLAIGALVCAVLFAVLVAVVVKRSSSSGSTLNNRRSSARSKDMGTFSRFPHLTDVGGADFAAPPPRREPSGVYDSVPDAVVPSSYANMQMGSGIIYDTVLQRPVNDRWENEVNSG